ncbi:hypothetical protein ACOMHN_055561 [Nucella lapillus]
MFGVTTPISRCRPHARHQDFDSLRTILSCSKIESKWTEHVRPGQGDLFYIDVDGMTRARKNSLPKTSPPPLLPPSSDPAADTDLSRQNGERHSDNARTPSRYLRGSASEEDEEDRRRSRSELRKKSKQLQQALQKKQDQWKNGEVKGVEQLRKFRTANNGECDAPVPHDGHCRMSSQTAETPDRVNGHAVGQKRPGASQQQKNGPHFKDVILVPDFSRHSDWASKLGSGAEVFELLLGIALCRYRQRSAAPAGGDGGECRGEGRERKLVVQGVVAGSPADKSGNVHRGDMLLHLNGQEVTWSNLNTVAQSIKREVRLTFQVPKIIGPTSCSTGGNSGPNGSITGSSRLPAYHNLCLLVTGRDIFNLQQQLLHYKCIALYLTLSGSGASDHTPNDDIVYSFPAQEEMLTNIRGLFLTLNASLQDSVQSAADISSLVIGGETVNVAYHQQGRDIFVLAAPSLRSVQGLFWWTGKVDCPFSQVSAGAHGGLGKWIAPSLRSVQGLVVDWESGLTLLSGQCRGSRWTGKVDCPFSQVSAGGCGGLGKWIAPSLRVPVCWLRGVMSDVCRMLTTVFGSVDRAFHGGESSQLDQVFALFFHRLLCQAGSDNSGEGAGDSDLVLSAPAWSYLGMDGLCAAPLLPLSEDNRLICDEILSEYEAVDFDDFLPVCVPPHDKCIVTDKPVCVPPHDKCIVTDKPVCVPPHDKCIVTDKPVCVPPHDKCIVTDKPVCVPPHDKCIVTDKPVCVPPHDKCIVTDKPVCVPPHDKCIVTDKPVCVPPHDKCIVTDKPVCVPPHDKCTVTDKPVCVPPHDKCTVTDKPVCVPPHDKCIVTDKPVCVPPHDKCIVTDKPVCVPPHDKCIVTDKPVCVPPHDKCTVTDKPVCVPPHDKCIVTDKPVCVPPHDKCIVTDKPVCVPPHDKCIVTDKPNYLVCSHLRESDLRDVVGFVQCHSLLTLAARQPLDELVVWQEVHLTRCSPLTGAAARNTPVGYQEPPARWFMLIVGMKHFVLGTLLEAGGCSGRVGGMGGPHPLFVDQARATLVQLDTDDVRMSHCCQDRLVEEQDSALTTGPERYVTHTKLARDDTAANLGKLPVTAKPPSPGRSGNDGPFKYRSSPRSDRRPAADSDAGSDTGAMTRQGSKLSYGSNDSGGSGSSTGASKPKTGRFSSLLDMSSIGRSMSALHIDTIGTPGPQGKLSRGRDNVVFHFIHYNDLEGILVTSADLDLTLAPGQIQTEVMANFHRCVLNLRAVFSERDVQTNDDSQKSPFERDVASGVGVEEQGVLFHCSSAAALPDHPRLTASLNYWVVGVK